MSQEIERKFLVKGIAWKTGAAGTLFRQGYLSRDKDRTVRVRIAGERAFLTVKSATEGISRSEFEYPVPIKDAEAMLRMSDGPVLEKKRYRVKYEEHIWEIDEFFGENKGLVVAEIELSNESEPFVKPDWAEEEVSGDPRYYNSNLAVLPFSRWEKKSG